MKITFLGTGTSHGVPMIACDCLTCRSTDPRDKRLRTSIYVELQDGTAILVDAGPDLRQQALTHNIRRVDAILFTHGHADHILGLDETRRFTESQGRALDCYGDPATLGDIRQTFSYVFDSVDAEWRRPAAARSDPDRADADDRRERDRSGACVCTASGPFSASASDPLPISPTAAASPTIAWAAAAQPGRPRPRRAAASVRTRPTSRCRKPSRPPVASPRGAPSSLTCATIWRMQRRTLRLPRWADWQLAC